MKWDRIDNWAQLKNKLEDRKPEAGGGRLNEPPSPLKKAARIVGGLAGGAMSGGRLQR